MISKFIESFIFPENLVIPSNAIINKKQFIIPLLGTRLKTRSS
jgi:hypothetical protein